MWSRNGVDAIGNLSGLKAVVFLWRFRTLLCDGEQFVGQDHRELPAFLLLKKEMTTDDIKKFVSHKPIYNGHSLPSDCTKNMRTTVHRSKLSYLDTFTAYFYSIYKLKVNFPIQSL